jgi:hypothetical protein
VELILEQDSDAHSSEDKEISAQNGSDTDSDMDGITDPNCTQWTDDKNC